MKIVCIDKRTKNILIKKKKNENDYEIIET